MYTQQLINKVFQSNQKTICLINESVKKLYVKYMPILLFVVQKKNSTVLKYLSCSDTFQSTKTKYQSVLQPFFFIILMWLCHFFWAAERKNGNTWHEIINTHHQHTPTKKNIIVGLFIKLKIVILLDNN